MHFLSRQKKHLARFNPTIDFCCDACVELHRSSYAGERVARQVCRAQKTLKHTQSQQNPAHFCLLKPDVLKIHNVRKRSPVFFRLNEKQIFFFKGNLCTLFFARVETLCAGCTSHLSPVKERYEPLPSFLLLILDVLRSFF